MTRLRIEVGRVQQLVIGLSSTLEMCDDGFAQFLLPLRRIGFDQRRLVGDFWLHIWQGGHFTLEMAKKPKAGGCGVVGGNVRVYLSPGHAKGLIAALSSQMARFEAKMGEVPMRGKMAIIEDDAKIQE